MPKKPKEAEKPKTKRFIIANRYGPRLDPQSIKELDSFVAASEEASIVRKTSVGRTVVEMTEDQVRDLAAKNPQLVIEEDEELKLFAMPGLPERVPAEGTFSLDVQVKDATDGNPVPEVSIYGIGAGVAYKTKTDKEGKASLTSYEPSLVRLIASPRDTHWSMVVPGINLQTTSAINLSLKPLVLTGAYDWGQRLMGFPNVNQCWTGNDINIGVIDSGIIDNHPDLTPAGGFNTLDGQDPKAWNVDEAGHGTHVAGIIAARNNQVGMSGGAAKAKVYSVKVFPGGFVSDLVEAVEWCIHNQIDVISMSLGSANPSQVLAMALRDAYDRGITSVAAVGNENSKVAYPAAYPTVLGVGAIGRFGTFPEDSAHMLKVGNTRDFQGGLFAASFTNFGQEVDVCAPGVAVLSTVPTGYAAWDGTSMACPMVSALVALILEANPAIRTGDPGQPEAVKAMLHKSSVNLGMPPHIQGRGFPLATMALAPAQPSPRRRVWDFPRAGTMY